MPICASALPIFASALAYTDSALATFVFALASAEAAQVPYPAVCKFSGAGRSLFPGGVIIGSLGDLV